MSYIRLYLNHREEVSTTSKRKKSGNQDNTVKYIVLVTAILNLIRSLVDIIQKLTG